MKTTRGNASQNKTDNSRFGNYISSCQAYLDVVATSLIPSFVFDFENSPSRSSGIHVINNTSRKPFYFCCENAVSKSLG